MVLSNCEGLNDDVPVWVCHHWEKQCIPVHCHVFVVAILKMIRLTIPKHHDDRVVDRNGRQRAVNVGAPHRLQQLAAWWFQIQSLDHLHCFDSVGQRRSPPSLKGFELKHLKSKVHVRHQSRPKNFKNGTIKIEYWGDTWGNGDRVKTIQFFQFGLSSCHRVSCLFTVTLSGFSSIRKRHVTRHQGKQTNYGCKPKDIKIHQYINNSSNVSSIQKNNPSKASDHGAHV